MLEQTIQKTITTALATALIGITFSVVTYHRSKDSLEPSRNPLKVFSKFEPKPNQKLNFVKKAAKLAIPVVATAAVGYGAYHLLGATATEPQPTNPPLKLFYESLDPCSPVDRKYDFFADCPCTTVSAAKRYKELVLKFHPDKNPTCKNVTNKNTIIINDQYESHKKISESMEKTIKSYDYDSEMYKRICKNMKDHMKNI